jgi:hypothetical protein
MEFAELLRLIMLLPPEMKQMLAGIINEDPFVLGVDHLDSLHLHQTPEWKEMNRRANEVVYEEKTCLIEFDEHLQSIRL